MRELLLELLSEEIPARMQSSACTDLCDHIVTSFEISGIKDLSSRSYATPRRLCIHISNLPERAPDRVVERRGPKETAPAEAIKGFAASAGIEIADLELRETAKGKYFFSRSVFPGDGIEQILPEVLTSALHAYRWPKSMRWGSGEARWVRPLVSILCLMSDGSSARVVPMRFAGLASGLTTSGHRFRAPQPFQVDSFEDYRHKLAQAFVILDAKERKRRIRSEMERATEGLSLQILEDEDLLNEVAGLVEWPEIVLGDIDPSYRAMPPELLTEVMRSHQKYFSVVDKLDGRLTHFIVVSNASRENSERVLQGNKRVLNARLKDAEHHWNTDSKAVQETGMGVFADALAGMRFHEKLGGQDQRVVRMAALAQNIAPLIGADQELAVMAAHVAKLDLVSLTVGEFPALQGITGSYLAESIDLAPEVSQAIREQYLPSGPEDRVPDAPISLALGLADRIDYLTGFFSVGEQPSGSKDPHALRRCALGIIRLILKNRLQLPLDPLFALALANHASEQQTTSIMNFIRDRLEIHLHQAGCRHDIIRACAAVPTQDDLLSIEQRSFALQNEIDSDEIQELILLYRRIDNILGAFSASNRPDRKLYQHSSETSLDAAIQTTNRAINKALETIEPSQAVQAAQCLQYPVKSFFDSVRVEDGNPKIRNNRLTLLATARASLNRIANFSVVKIGS